MINRSNSFLIRGTVITDFYIPTRNKWNKYESYLVMYHFKGGMLPYEHILDYVIIINLLILLCYRTYFTVIPVDVR